MGKLCDRGRQANLVDEHLTCVNVATAGIYTLDANNPCSIIPETGDCCFGYRDVDLDSATVTAPSQVIEVSVHQAPVEAPPAIDEGQAPTMDTCNLLPGAGSARGGATERHVEGVAIVAQSGPILGLADVYA